MKRGVFGACNSCILSLWCDAAFLVLILGLADGLGRAVEVALLPFCSSAVTELNPGPTPHRVCVFVGKRQQSGLWGKLFNLVTRVTCCAQMCVCRKSSLIAQTENQRDGWNNVFSFFFLIPFVKDTLLLADVAEEAWTTTEFRYDPSYAVTFAHTPFPRSLSILGWVLSGFSVVCWPLISSLWLNRKYTNPVPCVKLITPAQACVCVCARANMRHCVPLHVCCVSGVGEGIKGKPRHRGDLKNER